jgi:hypothetical protein
MNFNELSVEVGRAMDNGLGGKERLDLIVALADGDLVLVNGIFENTIIRKTNEPAGVLAASSVFNDAAVHDPAFPHGHTGERVANVHP